MMRKSIFIYSLFALGYLGFATIPLTESSAQTIRIISGNNQSTTRDQKFPHPVTFKVTDDNGVALSGKKVLISPDADHQNAEISLTATGPFSGSKLDPNPQTDGNGEVTIYVKATRDTLYNICPVGAIIAGDLFSVAFFRGRITDVLYFPSDATTRSVDERTAIGTSIGDPVSATHWRNTDGDNTNDVVLTYSLEGSDAASFSIDSDTGQLKVNTDLDYYIKSTYSVTVKVKEKDMGVVRSSDTIRVIINVNDPGLPLVENNPVENQRLTLKRINQRTVTLSWKLPTSINAAAIIEYQYSIDGGKTWTSTRSRDTSITITGDEVGTLSRGKFKVRAVSRNAGSTVRLVTAVISARRNIIQDCPVGWVRSDGFAGRNRRALLYEVKVEMDIRDPVSIYKPAWIAIYVHPDEGLENLDGWKLQVALPYNRHREYPLTAENSVIVDAGFVEGGFAFIVPPKASPFPMTGMGFPGSPAPGFDYRLYDDQGRRVDFGISCYKRFDIFQVLKDAEDPRVLRQVHLETYDWNTPYLRSEWTVPTPAPAAPSQIKKNIVGTWADLKKQ